MTKHLILLLFALTLFLNSSSSYAQNHTDDVKIQEMGLDERINEKFKPIAEWWECFVLTSFFICQPDNAHPELNSKLSFGFLSKAGSLKAQGYSVTVIPLVLLILIFGAVLFTLAFRFINIRRFPLAINVVRGEYEAIENYGHEVVYENPELLTVDGDIPGTIRDEGHEGEVSHFQALATAVSGTVGLGNIAGVAVAIAVGGPGATFWMIVCGLLGMSTKFVECTLGVRYRDVEKDGTVHGGPMYYLSKGLTEKNQATLGKILAGIFAVLCVGASFGGGNAFQSNQAAQQIIQMVNMQSGAAGFMIGVGLAILVAVVIIGGIKSIAKVTEKIVPFMAIFYVIACLVIIFSKITYIGEAFAEIWNGAFTPAAGLGGMIGVILVGFQRAAFSNEAGAGSAAIAHSAVKTKYPVSEGIVALLEPFIDTVVICTMTALVIIFFNIHGDGSFVFNYGNLDGSNNVILNDGSGSLGGVGLTSAAFAEVLPWFPYVLTIAIVLFAFSTMVSWSYYGLQSWKYLFGRSKTSDITYKIIFIIMVVIGASATLDAVIKFSDAMILALVFPNMIGLILLYPEVQKELKRYLNGIKKVKGNVPGIE